MNYKYILLIFFLLNIASSFAQDSIKKLEKDYFIKNNIDSKAKSYGVGLTFRNYQIVNGWSTPKSELFMPIFSLRFNYNPQNKTTVGFDYSHQPVWGTNIPKVLHFFYTGPYVRYDILRKKNASYLEIGYRISNTKWLSDSFLIQQKFPVHYATLGWGIKAKIYPNIYFNYYQNVMFDVDKKFKKENLLVDKKFGLEFFFNTKQKDTPLLVTNNKRDRTGKFVLGLSAAFMPFDSRDYDGGYLVYATTHRLGFYQSSFLSFGIYTGLDIGDSLLPNTPAQAFYYVGPFINLKFLALRKINYVVEFSYLSSNFTTVDGLTNIPPLKGYSEYFTIAFGPSIRLNDRTSIEIAGIKGTCITSPYQCKGGGVGGYRLGIERTFDLKRKKTIRSNG